MSININLSAEQFFKLFNGSEFLAGMTYEGVCAVLDYIESVTDENEVVDWTAYFIEAGEYSEADVFSDFKYLNDTADIDELIESIKLNHTVLELGDECGFEAGYIII